MIKEAYNWMRPILEDFEIVLFFSFPILYIQNNKIEENNGFSYSFAAKLCIANL
jgi:hypothetical protein